MSTVGVSSATIRNRRIPTVSSIWVVIEEIDSGSFADGSTYCPLSAHRTEAGAEEKVAKYDEENGEVNEDGWNKGGTCAAVHELELED